MTPPRRLQRRLALLAALRRLSLEAREQAGRVDDDALSEDPELARFEREALMELHQQLERRVLRLRHGQLAVEARYGRRR